jgi:kinesin family protein 4/21/27
VSFLLLSFIEPFFFYNSEDMGDDCPVRVAIRVRPLVPRETNEGCQTCLTFARDQHQLTVGTNRAFSYDFVLPPEASQEELYSQAVKPLIEKIYSGYNSTVLAYGQTGSGKTFTMGTGDALTMDDGTGEVTELTGVVPRVVRDLFDGFKDREHLWQCDVTCSFFELYNEEINDLFAKLKGKTQVVNIREINNEILLSGLTEEGATSPSEVLWLLTHASEGRSVGSTAMNQQSSRSHAIFTINVTMSRKDDPDGRDKMTAKFQLVDLAGSERAKKTKAEGERFKEGVNINRGLLALGNVIAALGDEKTRGGKYQRS